MTDETNASATDAVAEPTDLLALQRSCDEYLAGWKRAQADYANLKKDSERAMQEFAKFANERLLESLLPAVDQYDTALMHTPDLAGIGEDVRKKWENWIVGLNAVRSTWKSELRSVGVEPVDVAGAFDPMKHDAVAEESSDTIPEGDIIRVVQNGWTIHGKLIRPARVVVSKGKS